MAVSEVSLEIDVAMILTSAAPHFKMVWILCQSCADLGVPAVVAGPTHLGELNLPVPGTPVLSNCPSVTYTHTTHVAYVPLTPFLCHTFSLPAVN